MAYQDIASHDSITETLTERAKRIIDCLEGNRDRRELVQYGEHLVDAVEQLWRGVRQGDCRVESIALLRVLRQTTCRETLSPPEIVMESPRKLASELRLFVNTVRYVLKPTYLRNP